MKNVRFKQYDTVLTVVNAEFHLKSTVRIYGLKSTGPLKSICAKEIEIFVLNCLFEDVSK